MKEHETSYIRNLALVSHAGAGKTTLVEAFLFKSGMTSRLGKIEDGSTVGDFDPEEIERKISIRSKLLYLEWKDHKVNIVDTPGYADFVGEVISSLGMVESAIVLIDAVTGIGIGTENVWELLDSNNLPRVIFINRLDKENADFFVICGSIQERFGLKCIPAQVPLGLASSFKGSVNLLNKEEMVSLSGEDRSKAEQLREKLIEAIAETSDALVEKYLEAGGLSPDEIEKGFKEGVSTGKIIPIFCGSALGNISIEPMLDAIVRYLPSPAERGQIEGVKPKTGEAEARSPDEKSPFSAQVFKTMFDPYVGQITIVKVFSGSISSDSVFYNATKGQKERVGQLYLLQGKEQNPISCVKAGDLVAMAKLKATATGDTLCDEKNTILYPHLAFPEPAISFSVRPKSRQDEERISESLSKLAGEDLTFKVYRDPEIKELIISGIGSLHLEVMISILKRKFGVQVEIGTPKVAYKETIHGKVQVQGKYKRQSGGRGQYGDVWLELEPLPRGEDFEFVNKIVGGAIPRNFIPAVEKGVREAMVKGIIAGYPLVNIKVTLYDGSYHVVDSSDIAFQIAGSMALRDGVLKANPGLLEPIMDVEAVIPEEYMGEITGDLNSRRGKILGMDTKGKLQVVKAKVPVAELAKYATDLRSMTGGRGNYSMKFSHYENVPQKISDTIIARYRESKKKEA